MVDGSLEFKYRSSHKFNRLIDYKMQRFLRKLSILKDSLIGYAKKGLIDLRDPDKYFDEKKRKVPIIVSLTSYGRRVNSVVYYTLISILNQTIQPLKIILWLDESWTEKSLPKKLLALKKYGIEIRFCSNIKSYKKLLPTLQEISDYPIVTIDDDVMYTPYFLESLYNSYLSEPQKIHCTHALAPVMKNSSEFETYVDWPEFDGKNNNKYIFPIGEGGVLYPPNSLHKDVNNIELAMSLCPYADDIWFWVMALKNGTQHNIVNLKKTFYSFDALYQYFHKGSALTHSNAKENKNDIQLKNVISYFNLKF